MPTQFSPEHQSAQMSKIKNGGVLDQYAVKLCVYIYLHCIIKINQLSVLS